MKHRRGADLQQRGNNKVEGAKEKKKKKGGK